MDDLTLRLTVVFTDYLTKIAEALRRQAGEPEMTREHVVRAEGTALQVMGRLRGRMQELAWDPTMREADRFGTAKSDADAEVASLIATLVDK